MHECFVNFNVYNLIGDGVDYYSTQYTMYTVSFPAGVTCASLDVPIKINDDLISEADEVFDIYVVEILLPYGVIIDNKAKVIILDNDCKYIHTATYYYIYV